MRLYFGWSSPSWVLDIELNGYHFDTVRLADRRDGWACGLEVGEEEKGSDGD
jgi:hypothetical protein